MSDSDQINRVLDMVEEGHPIPQVAYETQIPEDVIHKNLSTWLQARKDSRFITKTKQSLSPTSVMEDVMANSQSALESGDVETFFEDVSPIVAQQLVRDSITSPDPKVRLAAQRDILDRAGYKPKDKVEIYSKFDKMTQKELIATIVGRLEHMRLQQQGRDQAALIEGECEEVQDDGPQ